jgi:hypothetical protein
MRLIQIDKELSLLVMRTSDRGHETFIFFVNEDPVVVIDNEHKTMGMVEGRERPGVAAHLPKIIEYTGDNILPEEEITHQDAIILPRTMVYSCIYEPIIPRKKQDFAVEGRRV